MPQKLDHAASSDLMKGLLMKVNKYCVNFILVFLLSTITFLNIFAQDIRKSANQPDKFLKYNLTLQEKEWLAKKNIVRVRIRDWPPFMFTKPKVKGIMIDYLDYIAKELGLNIIYMSTNESLEKFLKQIENEEIYDLTPALTPTEEREKYLSFSRPYIELEQVIFTRENNNSVYGIKDLFGKTVVIQKGYALDQQLKQRYPQIKLLPVKDTEDAMVALSTSKADAYIGNIIVGSHFIRDLGLSNLKIAAPVPFESEKLAFASRKDWPELISSINKVLNSMTPEEQNSIKNKWLSVRYEYGVSMTDILKWIFIPICSLLIVLIFILIWNRKLKNEIAERIKIEKEIKVLQGFLPICSYCKKIREDDGDWSMVEAYVAKHSEAVFSHGICPECYEKQMKEIDKK